MNIVWFKRDLRIHDHPALIQAVEDNHPVLPLYILEPELWRQPDLSYRQYRFLLDCLNELDSDLKSLGQGLIVKVGDAVSILKELHTKHTINALFSHQETWNGWTYERDKAVLKWTKEQTIPWHEPVQNGVIRRLKDRDGWASRWYGYMKQSTLKPPQALQSIDEPSDALPDNCGGHDDCLPEKGGRRMGIKVLKGFLENRGEHYTKEMSSPVTAFESCSRLSAHIAFGTLSVREVFQACERRTNALQQMPPALRGRWPSAMRSFSGRLRWHCHFIQKLEDEPRIEFENMHSAYNGLRESEFNDEYFEAWKSGKTGYPMIDACMRALTATGWLNFRMRAMLMSFSSYHLWLHWRKSALHLASLFTDYEPGIHYSQVQMQSGTTGINSIRIYNPIKQGVDHDPEGTFIRQWIPELEHMETHFIHTPWKAPSHMNGYPMPIVDEKVARKTAADKLYALRKQAEHKETARKIVKKHASRKSGQSARPTKAKQKDTTQGELPL